MIKNDTKLCDFFNRKISENMHKKLPPKTGETLRTLRNFITSCRMITSGQDFVEGCFSRKLTKICKKRQG